MSEEDGMAVSGSGVRVYVVQVKTEGRAVSEAEVWMDAATVSVPARSKRRAVLEAARVAGVEFPATVRILDASAAEELVVGFGDAGPPPLVVSCARRATLRARAVVRSEASVIS